MGSALPKLKLINSITKNNFPTKSRLYVIRAPLRDGGTGQVFQCKLFQQKKDVAVKIVHKHFPWSGKRELSALKKLSKLDPDKNNLIRFNRHFIHRGRLCLEYELLDQTLYNFMELRFFKPLCLSEIRVIAQQLLVALNALKSIGLAHGNISPKKVMLVNELELNQVKLIGFGAAGPVSTFRYSTTGQDIFYRAPENLMGRPVNEASDMWALGCTLAFLYLGYHLYPIQSEYHTMRVIVQMHGLPDEHMLKNSGRTRAFFSRKNNTWSLNDEYAYYLRTGHNAHTNEWIRNKFTSLDKMVEAYSERKKGAEYEDTQAFFSLLKQMLQVDPEKRITPSKALEHSFVTKKHFHHYLGPYAKSARLAMEECQQEHSLVECVSFGIFNRVLSRPPIKKNYILLDKSGMYQIREPLAKGFTGHVVRCKLFQRAKDVAVKMMHDTIPVHDKGELATIEKLSMLDPDKNNLIRFNWHFSQCGYSCLEYELLDKNLYNFMKLQDFKPLCLSEIRVIAQQLLVALNALKSIGLAHKDIKPEKVMFVNQLQSFRVKLIGFGAAGPISELRHGTTDQCIAYRAPEDLLGLPMNEASDMWALGCTLAFLYLGQHLYPTKTEYEVMRVIVQMQGLPDEHMLKDGGRSRRFFTNKYNSWRLKTVFDYKCDTLDEFIKFEGISNEFTSLDDMAKTHSEVKNGAEYEDTQAFLSLIKQMLQVNPEKRITPSKALGHSFITMKHFHTNKDPYVASACVAMEAYRLEQSSVECRPFETSRKVIGWNGSSITKLDDTLSAGDRTEENEPPAATDIVTAGTKKTGLQDKLASADFKDPTHAGTDEKASGTDKAASASSVSHNTHEGNTNFHTNIDPYVTSACLDMEAYLMEQSSVECRPFETSRKVIGWNGSSITKLDDTLSAGDRTEENEPPAATDIVTAGTKKTGLQDKLASAGFKDPTHAGTDEKALGTDKAASPTSVIHNTHEGNTNNDKGNTDFVEVKCRKKWLKKIKRFFSRIIKP